MGTRRRRHGDLEHEVLAVLTESEAPMTPEEVRVRLAGDLAYNTVTTVLVRLFAKGLVSREPAGRAYAYRAVRESAQVTAFRMRRLLDSEGDRAAVLARFVGTLTPGDEELLSDLLRSADPDQR